MYYKYQKVPKYCILLIEILHVTLVIIIIPTAYYCHSIENVILCNIVKYNILYYNFRDLMFYLESSLI